MRGFVFTLQPVLDLRVREEQRRQLAAGEAERERLALEAELRACQDAVRLEREDLRERLAHGPVDLRGARVQAHASLGSMLRTRRAALRLVAVHARAEMARRALLAAAADRKAAELLRDRQREAWEREQARRERIESDEVGAAMARREAGEA